MSKIIRQIRQCRLCCSKAKDQINLQRETEFIQYVVETIGQHINEVGATHYGFVCDTLKCY